MKKMNGKYTPKNQKSFIAGFWLTGKVVYVANMIPMYLQIHDEEQILDLKNEKQISSEKIWKTYSFENRPVRKSTLFHAQKEKGVLLTLSPLPLNSSSC